VAQPTSLGRRLPPSREAARCRYCLRPMPPPPIVAPRWMLPHPSGYKKPFAATKNPRFHFPLLLLYFLPTAQTLAPAAVQPHCSSPPQAPARCYEAPHRRLDPPRRPALAGKPWVDGIEAIFLAVIRAPMRPCSRLRPSLA
jgi:hypothetical protein